MATHWYYAKNGTKQGPVSSRELKNLAGDPRNPLGQRQRLHLQGVPGGAC
jgi:hypothetical protein